MNKEIGCSRCPYAGHIELKECPDAYTEVSQYCYLYKHEPIEQENGGQTMKVSDCKKCVFCKRKTWTSYYKPVDYHAIGITHAYHYCERYKKKCLIIKGCGAFVSKEGGRQ